MGQKPHTTDFLSRPCFQLLRVFVVFEREIKVQTARSHYPCMKTELLDGTWLGRHAVRSNEDQDNHARRRREGSSQ
jgi:hypothetical protein